MIKTEATETEYLAYRESLLRGNRLPESMLPVVESLGVSTMYDQYWHIKNKLEIVINYRDFFINRKSDNPVLYSCSGFDWQFPILLGIRRIIMLDLCFNNQQIRDALADEIKTILKIDVDLQGNTLHFKFNNQDYQIVLVAQDLDEYSPESNLDGIIEYLGVSSQYSSALVLPAIAKKLLNGSFLAFFTEHNSVIQNIKGIKPIKRKLTFGDLRRLLGTAFKRNMNTSKIYQVIDSEALNDCSLHAYSDKRESDVPAVPSIHVN